MFENREDAGTKLCPKLKKFLKNKDVVIVGLTKGGIITAKPVSICLGFKLKALVVKKIGAPKNEELAIGAIVTSKDVYWNNYLLKKLKIDKDKRKRMVSDKIKEIESLVQKLQIRETKGEYKNKNVILVDDGVATGSSVMAAAKYLKRNRVKSIILATPVIAYDTLNDIKIYFDDIIYLKKRANFYAVGQFYRDFNQVTDEDVSSALTLDH